MSRYTPNSPWTIDQHAEIDDVRVTIESADALDKQSGTTYREGAFRVLVGGKPVKGKGGTVPFYGESAWSAADRLFSDITLKLRYAS